MGTPHLQGHALQPRVTMSPNAAKSMPLSVPNTADAVKRTEPRQDADRPSGLRLVAEPYARPGLGENAGCAAEGIDTLNGQSYAASMERVAKEGRKVEQLPTGEKSPLDVFAGLAPRRGGSLRTSTRMSGASWLR